MGNQKSPTVRRRRLAMELRRLREAAGLTHHKVAEHLDCSQGKISQIESGRVSVRATDVRMMLELYGVTGSKVDELLVLAKESRQKGWWHAYGDVLPEPFQVYVGLESAAAELRTYEPQLVPGLLQTEDYARAVASAEPGQRQEDIKRWVELRMARQQLLARMDPPQLWTIIDEAVLRRRVGGPRVMQAQLMHLAEMAEEHHITLQILSFGAGAHPSMVGSFIILGFPERTDPDVVYLENHTGSLYLEKAADIDRYSLIFDYLRATALGPVESVEMINAVAKEL